MNSFWRHCLSHFERELPQQQFVTWIKPLRCQTEGDTLTLKGIENPWNEVWKRVK